MLSLGPVLLAQLTLQTLRSGQQLALVYLLIRAWGATYYGDWVVLMTTATFFTVFDFGIQTVLSNQCLGLSRDEDTESLSKLIGHFLGFYLLFVPTVCLLTIGVVLAFGISPLAPTSLLTGGTRDVVFLALAFSFLFGIPLNALGSVYAARGHVAKGIGRVSIQLAIQTILLVIIIEVKSDDVIAIAMAYPISTLLCLFWVMFDISRRYPSLSLRPRMDGAFVCLRFLRLGVFYFISPFAGFLSQNVPIFFVASVVGDSKLVAAYAVIRTLVGLLRQLTIQISNAVGAEIMRRWVRRETDESQELFADANRFISAMSGLLAGFVLAVTPPFIALWTQNKISVDPRITLILVSTLCLASPTYLPIALLQVGNRPHVLTAAAMLQAGLSCLFAFVMPPDKFLYLLILLGLTECLISLFVTLWARAQLKLINLQKIMTSYLICGVAGGLAFGISEASLAVVPQNGMLPFLISCLITGVPFLLLLFILGLSAQARNDILVRVSTHPRAKD
jgi:O-antigen/teichoic acid export membrane protein